MSRRFRHLNQKTIRYFSLIILWFFILAGPCFADSTELKQNLNNQINDLQEQINSYRQSINDLEKQSKTLKGQVSILDSKIKASNLEIRRTNLMIKNAEGEIDKKNDEFSDSEKKLAREKEMLGEYVRQLNDYDQRSFLEVFLTGEKLSGLFEEMNSLEEVQQGIQDSMAQINELKTALVEDKQVLEEKIDELNQLKVAQQIQQQSILSDQQEKNDLLNQTKGQEKNYQALLNKAKTDIQSIKDQLYLLEGVGLSMSLEKAYGYAKIAGDLTGVRPAFLLAVLKKESSWGEKVGTGTWRKDMHPRDQKAFLEICDKLNLDPDKTPVSRKPSYGWGGAMGPAQFLPATWLSYEERIASLTGHNPPDPYDIEDAFVAAGLKMAQAGASSKTYYAEWKAAQVYFAGSRWNNPVYYFYGDQVMEMATAIQGQLDLITK